VTALTSKQRSKRKIPMALVPRIMSTNGYDFQKETCASIVITMAIELSAELLDFTLNYTRKDMVKNGVH
jgi:hypothetical protein